MAYPEALMAETATVCLFPSSPPEMSAAWRFQFHRPSGAPKLDEEGVRLVSEALDRARQKVGDPDTLREYTVRARHDAAFIGFLQHFRFPLTTAERLAALALFKTDPLPASPPALAVLLEYCSRYRHVVAADLNLIRFYQILHYFNPQAAEAFADVHRVAPDLEAELVFRNIARDFNITRSVKPIAIGECIQHFNQASLMDGLEAFFVDEHIGLRRRDASGGAYAEAVIRISDFSRFVLLAYADSRLSILRLIQSYGALRALCAPLIKTYLAYHDADQVVLESEIQHVILGRPRFLTTPQEAAED